MTGTDLTDGRKIITVVFRKIITKPAIISKLPFFAVLIINTIAQVIAVCRISGKRILAKQGVGRKNAIGLYFIIRITMTVLKIEIGRKIPIIIIQIYAYKLVSIFALIQASRYATSKSNANAFF